MEDLTTTSTMEDLTTTSTMEDLTTTSTMEDLTTTSTMEDLTTTVTYVVISLTLTLVTYVLYSSWTSNVFSTMGVKYLPHWPAIGNFPALMKSGLIGFHSSVYNEYKGEKMVGFFEGSKPMLVVKDLDLLQEIMVKNFNCFVNRRVFTAEEPLNHALTMIEDDHWRHVRNTVSPAFSTGKLKKMSQLVENTAKSLTSNLGKACREGTEVELKHICGCFSMDVIANTGFGITIDSLNDEESQFVSEAKNITNFGDGFIALLLLFPKLFKVLSKLGVGLLPKKSVRFFNAFLDVAMESRKAAADAGGRKPQDFVQLMAAEEKKHKEASGSTENGSVGVGEGRKGLSRLDMQGQAFIFIIAGYDTVATVLSFTLFILAHKPDVTRKIQDELDDILAGKPAAYDNVASLVYLDMCLNEAMRMFPPGFIIDRTCTRDCVVDGVTIPKGMTVVFPIVSIFRDPEIFPDPDEFDPERFTAENKESRHPFAFLPFGQGPRNCIGMRLALLEMKIALASLLQEMTPAPCSKSVYPPKLSKFQMVAEDGAWVKFVPRNQQ